MITGKFNISEADKKPLMSTIASIVERDTDILFSYMFGSFSSGTRFSDIDVAVFLAVSGRREDALSRELELESRLEKSIRFPTDVRILNNAPISFIYNVLKSGVLIVDKDSYRRSDFESLVYREYFDVQRLRREYLREVVDAPV